jgi:hypothetical protein
VHDISVTLLLCDAVIVVFLAGELLQVLAMVQQRCLIGEHVIRCQQEPIVMELWMRGACPILVMTPLVAAVSIDPRLIPNFAVWSLAAGLPLLVQVARHR